MSNIKDDESAAIRLLESRGYLVVVFTPAEVAVATVEPDEIQDYLIGHANEMFNLDGHEDEGYGEEGDEE
jgi:hypothetical protein